MSSSIDNLAKTLYKTLSDTDSKKPKPADDQAIVTKVDGDTVWVKIPGGVDETPVRRTIDARPGDLVQVRRSGGRAWITGNASNPPTDDTQANIATRHAVVARDKAETAAVVAEDAQGTAHIAKTTAESILIYDHEYIMNGTTAIFTAHVYQGGVDITNQFESDQFTWELKTEDGTTYLGSGYQMQVSTTDCGYGAEVIGTFSIPEDSEALTANGDYLTNNEGANYSVRATGDAVKVRELTVSTNIYSAEKLMVVGATDEHLVSIQTLQDYLNLHLDKQILFGTTAEWNAQAGLQSANNTIYIYKDHRTVGNQVIAGIKVGDGNAYLIDLPFTDEAEMEHMADTDIHITASERLFWNNKVSCYYSSSDTLIFTTS